MRMLSRGERPVHSWAEKGLIVPEPGSVAESEAHVVRGEYQLPVFVVKSDIFNQNHESAPAFSSSGQVFLREDLPEIGRGDIGAHEAGHAMKQMGYRPYLDFIEKTPDFIDMYNPIAKIFLEHAAKHIGIELGNMSEQDAIDLYDEINNMVYGAIHAGRTEVLNLVRPAFFDFDAYSAELSSIHEQFKKERSNGTRFLLKSKDSQGQRLTQAQYKDALRAGRLDGKETVVRETSSVYTDTVYKQKGGAGTDGEAVHLRDGGQRAGGAYPGGQVSAVAQGAGSPQVWNWQGRSADGEASRLSYGEKVSTASLGIGGGSTQAAVRLVTGGETAAMTKAKAEAKKRGLRLVFFAGDNLSIRDASGEMASVCGYISGDRVFVRVDHPMYTADQIMRHEAGHDMIKKGEVDIDAVRERIAEEFGADKTEALAKLYMDAYAGTGLSPEDVWEEIICDSLGDMNIFAKDVQAAAPAAWELLQEIKKATENTRKAPARAPPAATDTKVGGKTSMDLDDLRDNIRKAPGIKWNGGRPIVLSRSEYAAVTSRISTRYHYANTRHDGVQIIDQTTDGKNAQHYVYLYTDHGFGSYQIVGRLSYGRNDALISFLREEIGNDRTAEGISQGAHQLRDFYEYPDSSGLSHYNGTAYDGNEQTHTGGRKGGEGSKRRTGRADTGRYDEGSVGEVKQNFSMETPVEQEETLVALHNMHEKKLRPSRAGQLDATSSNQAGGLVNNQAAKKLHNAATIDTLARKLGVTVVAEETILGPDGRPGGVNGFVQDGVVHIALDAENPALVVFKHEITHLFQQQNASGYQAFRDYAVQVMGWAEVARIQALYRENGVELSWEEAMDEVAADFTEQLLTDQRAVRLLIQDNRTLAQKMFDVIRDLARQLSGKEGAQLRKAEKMWIRMFEEAAGQENTSYDARGERYSTRAQRGRTIELETLENNRFQRLRQFKEQLPSEWYAFTADYFYVYSNQSFTDYTILVKARLTNANRADIEAFTEVLNHGTHEGTKTFDRWSEYFRRGKGRDRWHRVDTGKAGTAGRSDGVDVSASGGNHRGNPTPDSPTREATGIGRRDNPGPNTRYTLNQQDGRGQTSDLGEAATGHFARGTMQARDSEKEETRNGRARREETRDDFLRRSIQEGLQTVDGGQVVYGFRRLDRKSARQNARQVLEEVICLGLDADIIDGNQVIRNFDGVTTTRPLSQVTTIARKRTLINNDTLLSPRNIAGHEAFHSWKNGIGRDLYIECLQDNLDFSSAAFLKYQSEVSQTIFGQEVDLSDSEQMGRFTEELYAYISGDIHEGANDEMLRPMFRDFDAVKAAWETLVWKNSRLTEYSASDGTRFPLSQEPGEDADQRLRSRGFTDAAGDAHTAVRYSLSQPDGRRMPVLANMPYATLASVSEHLDLLKRAKQGDHSAARKLIDATLKDDLIEQVVRYFPTAVITPVQGSREGNVLPLELAKAIARRTQSPLFTQVYQQTHRAMKEQENSWARLLNPIFFDFEGERPDLSGQHFLLVDDVISSGSTLLALAHALEQAGGVVDGYVSLARGRFVADDMAISHEVCQRLEQTIGRAIIQDFLAQHLGYPVILEHLTEKQGRAILAHKNEILAWAQTAQPLHGRDELTARYSIKKGRLSPSAASGQKFWHPKLTNQEWSLLQGRIALEVERPENFLDGATKWLYAAEQGVNVFCIYGIGDGAAPTPLYASGGKIAAREKAYLNEYLEGKNHGADRTWTAFNRRLAALSPGGVAKNRHLPQNGFPGEEAGDGALHWNSQQRDGGGVDGRGSRNRGGIDRSSEPGLPSRHTRLEEHPAKQKRFSRKQRNVRLGDAGVLPSRARKYFTVDKKRKNLTAEEYVQYASTKGQTAYDILMDLAEESAYWALSDGDKSELVKDVYRYADVAGKASVSDYVPKGLDGELMALDADGFDLADYLLLRAAGEADGRSDLEIAVSAGDSALSTQLVLWNYDAQRTAEAFTDPGRSGYEYRMDEVQQAQFADLYEGYMQQALNRLFESSRYQKADVQVRRDMVSQLQSETNAEVKKEMARQLRADGVKSVRKN